MPADDQNQQTDETLALSEDLLKKKIQLTVNGEPQFLTLSEAVGKLQKGLAAERGFNELDEERKKFNREVAAARALSEGIKEEDPEKMFKGLVGLGTDPEKARKALYGDPDAAQDRGHDQYDDQQDGEQATNVQQIVQAVVAQLQPQFNTLNRLVKEREEEKQVKEKTSKQSEIRSALVQAIDTDEELSHIYRRSDDADKARLVERVAAAVAGRLKSGEYASFGPAAIRAGLTDEKGYLRRQGVNLGGQPPAPGAGSAPIPLTDSVHLSPEVAALIGGSRGEQPKKVKMSSPDFEASILADIARNVREG